MLNGVRDRWRHEVQPSMSPAEMSGGAILCAPYLSSAVSDIPLGSFICGVRCKIERYDLDRSDTEAYYVMI